MNIRNSLFVVLLVAACFTHAQAPKETKADLPRSAVEYSKDFLAGFGRGALGQISAAILIPTITFMRTVNSLRFIRRDGVMSPIKEAFAIIEQCRELRDKVQNNVTQLRAPEKAGFALATTAILFLSALGIQEFISNKNYVIVALLAPSMLVSAYIETGALNGFFAEPHEDIIEQ